MLVYPTRFVILGIAILACTARHADAQSAASAPAGRVAVSAGVDFLNAYTFRGLRQDDTGLINWPHVDVDLTVYSGEAGLKNVSAYVANWNSLHTGVAGSDGPSGERWYESDIRAGVRIRMARPLIVDASYTAYMSPNSMFTSVKEFALKLALDERVRAGRVSVRPYALVAFELDTKTGVGQADGGFDAGKYLEVGAAPRVGFDALDVAFPVRIGLSLGGYYELAGDDHTFGYSGVATSIAVPVGRRTRLGAWSIHGGVEYQVLGDTARVFNNHERTKVIGSLGIGWSE